MDWNKKLGYQKISSAITSALFDNALTYEEIMSFITSNFSDVSDSQSGTADQNDQDI